MDSELTKAIEDFDRAVDVEALQIGIGRAKRERAEQERAEQERAKQEVLFPPNGCPDHGDEGPSAVRPSPTPIPCHSGLSYALTRRIVITLF